MKILLALCIAASSLGQDSTIYTKDDGIVLPMVIKQVRAQYTSEAMHNRIEGTVTLSVVVQADGKVGDVTVTESLDAVYASTTKPSGDEAVGIQAGDERRQGRRRARRREDQVLDNVVFRAAAGRTSRTRVCAHPPLP